MPDKWAKPHSLGEIFNQSLDETYRLLKVGVYGWDGSAMQQLKVNSNGAVVFETPNGDSMVDDTNDALQVNVVAGSAGGTEFNEDAAHTSGDAGVMSLAVRNDGGGSLVGADGDYAPLQVNASGELITSASVTVNSEYAEDVAHTTGDDGTFVLGVRNDTLAALAGADGDYAPFQVDADGALYVNVASGSAASTQYNEDTAHSTGDTGTMALAVRQDSLDKLTSADGDYAPLKTDQHGSLYADTQAFHVIDKMDATAGWSVLGNDTINLATSTNHVCGTNSLEFDKADGADNTVFAGIEKTLTSFKAGPYLKAGGFILYSLYVSSITDIDYAFVRLGTDSSNYNEWRISGDILATGWNNVRIPILSPEASGITGSGWDCSAVTYGAVGVAFDAQSDTLADIRIDRLTLNAGMQTSADITAQISSEVSSPNVRVQKWGNDNVDTNTGNVGDGTLRVTAADDDTNLSAIKTAVETIDNAISGTEMQMDVVAALPAGDNNIGNVDIASAIPAGSNTIGSVKLTDGTETASVNASNYLEVAITQDDVGIGGGTQYTEDAAAAANPVGNAQILVRDDALSGQTTADGDNVAARGTDKGEIYVKHVDDVTIADGGNTITVDGTVSSNATLQTGSNTVGKVYITDGTEDASVNASNQLEVAVGNTVTVDLGTDNDVTIDSSSIVLAEDAVHSTGDAGVMALAVRNDTLAALAGADGDYAPLQVNGSGALYIQEGSALDVSAATVTVADDGNFTLAANSGVDIGDVDVTSVAGANFAAGEGSALPSEFVVVAGDDGTDTHPLQTNAGGDLKVTLDSESLDVSAATVTVSGTVTANLSATDNTVLDNIDSNTDFGAILPTATSDWKFADINDSTSGNNTIIAAQGAGNKIAVWSVMVVSDGTVDVRFEDGAAGTAFTGQIPLQAREGFTYSAGGVIPLWVGSADTLLNLELSAAVNVHGSISYTVVT